MLCLFMCLTHESDCADDNQVTTAAAAAVTPDYRFVAVVSHPLIPLLFKHTSLPIPVPRPAMAGNLTSPVRTPITQTGEKIDHAVMQQITNSTAAKVTSADAPDKMPAGPSFLQLNDTKAGMTGLDKEKINLIIQSASRNSPFYKRQQERQRKVDDEIADLLQRKSELTAEQIRCAEAEMDIKAAALEHKRRDRSRIIVHMDMDMFYAAVEMRDNPELAHMPLAVGSYQMLSTSNYEARKFGVRAGMAGFIALKLCPQLKIIPPDMEKYEIASDQCMSHVAEYDPNFRKGSVDEVYFDLTNYVLAKYNDSVAEDPLLHPVTRDMLSYPKAVWTMAADVVNELRNKIKENTRLTCSAGIAHNKRLAKVCSDLNKPDGQFLLDASDPLIVQNFVDNVTLRKIGGIGQVQEQHLRALNIITCKDLFDGRGLIQLVFSNHPAQIDFYLNVSLGVGSNDVTENDDAQRKSLGSETTFTATTNSRILNEHLAELSAVVSADLKKRNLKGRKVTLIIKWATFKSNDRSRRLSIPSNEESVICGAVQSLLQQAREKDSKTAIRLLGVRVSDFTDKDQTRKSQSSTSSSSISPAKKKRLTTTAKQKSITQFVRKPASESNNFQDVFKPISMSSRLHPDHDFICVYCLTQFANESLLEKHLDQRACPDLQAPDEVPDFPVQIRCPICDSSFPDLSSLNTHLDKCAK